MIRRSRAFSTPGAAAQTDDAEWHELEPEPEAMTLKGLRQGLGQTQAQVSVLASMTQSELSRIESRNDHLTSTLRRYVEALGGQLEVTAVFGTRRVKLIGA